MLMLFSVPLVLPDAAGVSPLQPINIEAEVSLLRRSLREAGRDVRARAVFFNRRARRRWRADRSPRQPKLRRDGPAGPRGERGEPLRAPYRRLLVRRTHLCR